MNLEDIGFCIMYVWSIYFIKCILKVHVLNSKLQQKQLKKTNNKIICNNCRDKNMLECNIYEWMDFSWLTQCFLQTYTNCNSISPEGNIHISWILHQWTNSNSEHVIKTVTHMVHHYCQIQYSQQSNFLSFLNFNFSGNPVCKQICGKMKETKSLLIQSCTILKSKVHPFFPYVKIRVKAMQSVFPQLGIA